MSKCSYHHRRETSKAKLGTHRSIPLRTRDWSDRWGQFMKTLNPDGIRALGELAGNVLTACTVSFVALYTLVVSPSWEAFGRRLFVSLILLNMLRSLPSKYGGNC